MKCTHCNKGFSCGCQKTKGANGRIVHKACLKEYNAVNGVKVSKATDNLTRQVQRAKQNLNR